MQKRFKLDKTTLLKIGKGALISMGAAAGIAFFNYAGTLEINDPYLASFIAWVVPFGINFIREWIKGEK